MTAAGAAPDGASQTYEQLVESLEELTRRMADGAIGIEEAVELYERAGRLHQQAAERLARVQARIERLAASNGPEAAGGEPGVG
ncbi:MAG TPA: exodeoxyribonuclease VII small subunit [Acidimicrobiales bacterium]|nr:exodeoxyribonuclease VII small subunit [Acidimicrobiales bacterium]